MLFNLQLDRVQDIAQCPLIEATDSTYLPLALQVKQMAAEYVVQHY